ncbi:MAG TPA: FtsX-like permease family protein [Treponemataceae bacterium]|nr:FtsX-like permease family protein [Treponemataceae bacterium]
MNTAGLAFRNLSRQKKRSFLLGGAVAFGFFIVTIVDALAAGSIRNFSEQFAFLFGGNVLVGGAEKNGEKISQVTRDDTMLREVLAESGINYQFDSKRTITYGTMIFEGKKAQTNIFGCDFEKETYFEKIMTLTNGSWDNVSNPKSIILSESVAKDLKIEVGDSLLVQLNTISGQATFGEFTLAAVSKDVSLIGSIAAYCHIQYLNELSGLAPDEFYIYSIMLNEQAEQDRAAQILEGLIAKRAPVTNRLEALKTHPSNPITGINKQLEETEWEGTKYLVQTFNDEVPQIKQILGTVQYVSLGILVGLFLIVMIGISNTYKMVIYERIKEIGTMRAIGMKKKDAGRIFMWESVLLSVFGSLAGFIAAVIGMSVLSLFTFTNEALTMFLQNGHWTYVLSPGSVILKLIVIIVLTMIAVSGSAKSAAKMNPADALRTSK